MSSIFLCHSSKDKIFVNKLANKLKDQNIRVWVDEAEIKIGSTLEETIANGIENMHYFAIVLSPDSIESSWVKFELDFAAKLEVKKDVKILPILYKDCEIPDFFNTKRFVDFKDESKFERGLEQILTTVSLSEFEIGMLKSVRNGLEAEFNAYKNLPIIDTKELEKYFEKNGQAFIRIYNLLIQHRKRSWIINNENNPSSYELIDIRLVNSEKGKYEIKTIEYFYLRWFDTFINVYVQSYDLKNEQSYFLNNENGVWKIQTNTYSSVENKVHKRNLTFYFAYMFRFLKFKFLSIFE